MLFRQAFAQFSLIDNASPEEIKSSSKFARSQLRPFFRPGFPLMDANAAGIFKGISRMHRTFIPLTGYCHPSYYEGQPSAFVRQEASTMKV